MTKTGNIIGVDLGGTNIRVGKVVDGKVVEISKSITPLDGTENDVLGKLYTTISDCFDADTKSIGIGVPSVVDTQKGIVYDVVNIPSWKEVALGDLLYQKFQVPVFINNDSNCFAVGEKIYGKGKGFQNIVGMTIGTGLGLGLIINGQLYEGRNCCAGEFGMLPYLNENYEFYCSGQFFSKFNSGDAADMHEKALSGDPNAIQLYQNFGKHIGIVIKSILYAYDPDIVLIGGSLSKAFDLYKEAMYDEISDFAFRSTLQNLKIEISELAESAILGAAALPTNALQSSLPGDVLSRLFHLSNI
ncbi:MAG: ROK family protein [Peptostreptococcaceae bacterium]|nr:ROK family protein [Peptostreptococcaceae bacterium]